MSLKAVFFDVGETLVDETRVWAGWADWLGIPRLTLMAVLGGVIQRGEHHHHALELVAPGFDLAREEAKRAAAGAPNTIGLEDLYPDAMPCLKALKDAGYLVGIAGNQPPQAEAALRRMGLPVDVIATSAALGVEKPSPDFFIRLAQAAGFPPDQIAYVGDRLDNDVLPARAAGMVAVFLRRGPWGYLHALRPEVSQAHLRIDSLAALPGALAQYARKR
ncbi:MAG: HAD family hydrolase [Chloroflexi bacterium]|nr:HAD family hydrolase [Chloroflexota bacterium]